MTMRIVTSPVVWVGLVVGVVIGLAVYIGGSSPASAALGAVIPIAYGVTVTILAARSDVSSVLAGRPIDERWEHIGLEATALTLGISAFVILGALAFQLASGKDAQPYAFAAAVMAAAYVVSLVVVRLRH
jgi:hypothetical protein